MKDDRKIVPLSELSMRAVEHEFVAERKHALRTRMIMLGLAGFILGGYVAGLAWFSFNAVPMAVASWFGF